MKDKRKNDEAKFQFDWKGLLALLVGLEFSLIGLSTYSATSIFYMIAAPAILIIFLNHYNWKNISLTFVLLICTVHPIRFIFDWWLNPIVYSLLAVVCLLLLYRVLRQYRWKNGLAALLLICTLLAGWQTIVSGIEVGNCGIEDRRWNYMYACLTSGNVYQQIEWLPIGMTGWCYYCPWY